MSGVVLQEMTSARRSWHDGRPTCSPRARPPCPESIPTTKWSWCKGEQSLVSLLIHAEGMRECVGVTRCELVACERRMPVECRQSQRSATNCSVFVIVLIALSCVCLCVVCLLLFICWRAFVSLCCSQRRGAGQISRSLGLSSRGDPCDRNTSVAIGADLWPVRDTF